MPPDTINLAIGREIAARRRELRMSLASVSLGCGVTLQQIHKYETGRSAVSAAMLVQLARCLDVPVGYFFRSLARRSDRNTGAVARQASPSA